VLKAVLMLVEKREFAKRRVGFFTRKNLMGEEKRAEMRRESETLDFYESTLLRTWFELSMLRFLDYSPSPIRVPIQIAKKLRWEKCTEGVVHFPMEVQMLRSGSNVLSHSVTRFVARSDLFSSSAIDIDH